ncbi:MAG: cardiolipin synthase [Bacteroidaceae bacterium]|nr:cardiolipin synthase [Bacteroidaceae bacterium]MBQ6799850.1 cardiolipin synthase [Bacteroidaceae bacterium]
MKMYRKIVRRQIRNLFFILILALPSLLQAADGVRSDSAMIAYLQSEGVTITQGNRVRLLKSGEEKFDDLFEAIRKARHYIHLEYFNFRNDSIAALLFAELDKKVQEGVKVRAMFDAFGNWSNNKPLKKKHLKELAKRGIEIVKFDPLNFPFIGDFMSRDHRKIVIIDGQTAYTGGMNVADYYIEGLPKVGKWRDMHIRIEGPAVDELQRIFLTMWEKATDERLTDAFYYFPSKTDSLHLPGTVDDVTIGIVDRVPRKSPKLMRNAYAKAILSAEEKIELINPYFIPTRTVRRALKKAAKKGVDVQVMVSVKGDIPITPDASMHVARQLHKCGATVYQFEDGFHHSKIMMVDDKFCTVGSTNLNSRSLRYDYEVNAFIFDPRVTDELSDMFNDDKRQSTVMTDENWKKRSRWHRFVGWISNLLLTPFL